MVAFGNFWDRSVTEVQEPVKVIPAGEYVAVCVDSQMRESKSGNTYLQMEWRIQGGEFANRAIWSRHMINDHGAAGQIARNAMDALERATGVIKPADSSMFHDIAVRIAVVVKAGKGDYGPTNEITNFMPARTSKPVVQQPMDSEPW